MGKVGLLVYSSWPMSFPENRPRRLRRTPAIRRLVRETTLSPDNFIFPLFVCPGRSVRREIASLPGQFHLSVDELVREAEEVASLGIPGVILFGLPRRRTRSAAKRGTTTASCSARYARSRRRCPSSCSIVDACFCEYTTHGHCGVIVEGEIDNDATLENLGRAALSYARAGADLVAPSGMMDGFAGFLREVAGRGGLRPDGPAGLLRQVRIRLLRPVSHAVDATPAFGDRAGYQMDPANVREAIREVALDVEEGADMVMVKPALAYLDIIAEARREFDVPIAAYNVSGEYAMLKAAAEKGWIDYDRVMMETLLSIRRAGADMILTYHAKEAARLLRGASAK